MPKSTSRYKKEYDEQTYKLCLLGATDAELADFFHVQESTINNWKRYHPTFLESIKSGKIIADAEVAESLYKRAKGYRYTETTSEDGKISKEVEKEVSPDTGACMAWLKNRQKAKWRDTQIIEANNVNVNQDITMLSPEERKTRLQELRNKLGEGE